MKLDMSSMSVAMVSHSGGTAFPALPPAAPPPAPEEEPEAPPHFLNPLPPDADWGAIQ